MLLDRATALAGAQDRWAALATPVFRNYDQDDGLPNPVATAIAEDADGFIWVGTEGGLARWDGNRFRVYVPVAGDAGALPDNWVTTLHVDAQDRLWVATSAGGIALYDRDHDSFKTYGAIKPGGKDDPGKANHLSSMNVRAVADDGAGGLWLGTDGGLDHLDPATGRITSHHHAAADAGSLPDDRVFALLRDRSGALWVGTWGGLVRLKPYGDRFAPVVVQGVLPGPVAISSLFEDSGGRVWIGSLHNGAFTMAPGEKAARPLEAVGDSAAALAGQRVFAIEEAAPNEIWLGIFGKGIVAVDMRSSRTHTVSQVPEVRQSLPDNTIWSLHLDRAGNMWVATSVGLSRLSALASGPAVSVLGDSDGRHGLTEPRLVEALAASADGNVWVGLASKGIDILDPAFGRLRNLAPDASRPEQAFPPTQMKALLQAPDGVMLLGTQHGLYRANPSGGGIARVEVPGRDKAGSVHGLFLAAGRLWIAGNDDGIWSMPLEALASPVSPMTNLTGKFAHLDAGQITDRRGTIVRQGLGNDLWIGTRNGLNRLDLLTGQIEQVWADRSNPAALASGYITGLAFDRSGRLWVGTMGGGIGVLTGRDAGRPVFRRLTTSEGLPDNNVDSLLVDGSGRFWAATDDGIVVIDPETFDVRALHRADGVEISAYFTTCATATEAGELLFGGAGGLTVIRPALLRPWNYRPPIVVTEVQIGGRPTNAAQFNGPRRARLEPLLVHPGDNSLTVEFAALDFSAPERNRYEYWMEGFDKGWTASPASRRLAAYTNLPPGRYTLHVRGSNREGAWTKTVLDIPIRVLPAWFQTDWFSLVLACAAIVSVLFLVQGRTVLLRRRQRELELLVAERTAELEESKRQVELIAHHDALTGLPNRRLFTEELRALTATASRSGAPFALLMIDLDHFKQVNDTLGHDAGDALLVGAARRMRAALRISDRLVRLGGDEFAVLVTDLSGAATARECVDLLCERIVTCFAVPVEFQGLEIIASVSIGAAISPANGTSPEAICKAADLALYDAKRAGRNTWRWQAETTDDELGLVAGSIE